ncbi:MAG: putative Ig domain-containing protein [Steroidobacteraceae bacterium]
MRDLRRLFAASLAIALLSSCGGGGGYGGGGGGSAPNSLSYPSPTTVTLGTAISPLSPSVTGAVTSYSVTPALPVGLSLDAMTGIISGTPTAVAAQATYTITATNSYGSTMFGLSLTSVNPAPSLSSVSPTSVAAGSSSLALTLQGTGFVTASTIQWNGVSLANTSATTVKLTATVPASDLLTLGDISVTVRNPGPGGGTSAPSLELVGGPLRVSYTQAGGNASGYAIDSAISADGRYVAFASSASDLVPGDTNANWDVFVRDTCVGAAGACVPTTQRVSVATDGTQGNGDSGYTPSNRDLGIAISGTGRYVAFVSAATNLVAGDTNAVDDVFVHDTCLGAPAGCAPTTTLISVALGGGPSNAMSAHPAISRTGRFVAFASLASNLVGNDTNNAYDIFYRDTCAGEPAGCVPQTYRVSLDASGTIQGNGDSIQPAFSGDERYLAFESSATNLVPGYTNQGGIYLHDTCFGAPAGCVPSTVVASLTASGAPASGGSSYPRVSLHGRYVAFNTTAQLVPADTNTVNDLYIRDTCNNAPAPCTPTTILASVTNAGNLPNADGVVKSALSDDGRYVAFESPDPVFFPSDPSPTFNVIVRDTCLGAPAGCVPATTRLSIPFGGATPPDGQSVDPALSADGSIMSFTSYSDNLVPGGVSPTGTANVYVVETH